jgi:hypothetical protein
MGRAGALSSADGGALARALDVDVTQLPAQVRGGSTGIFSGTNEDRGDGRFA